MRGILGVTIAAALGAGAVLAGAQEAPKAGPALPKPSPEAVQFFETKVRPLLSQHCFGCHSEKNRRGGLALHTAAGLRKGGDSGPVVQPGDPEKSLLLQVLNYDGPVKMPPQGKLKPEQMADLAAWVRMGAPWGVGSPETRVPSPSNTGLSTRDSGRSHWSFQPVRTPKVPLVRNRVWVRSPIDAFVLAKLEAKGLQPSQPASPRELIRRAYFDLLGLPPTPEEVEVFERECRDEALGRSGVKALGKTAAVSSTPQRPNAATPSTYERLIDRLLARPQFGERWGRHWLDVVRFAQTNGYERDDEKPEAWRYRDYVIQSLNADKPYNQFVTEQLAGDELDQVTDASITATGFYRLGVWDDEPDDPQQAEFDNLDDMLSTIGTAFMGLTVGCARCHDHKFDPIAQEEYYGLLAFMRNVRRYAVPDPKDANPPIFTVLSNGEKTLAISEAGPAVQKTHILIRGNAATPGAEVQPKFIRALCANPTALVPRLPTPPPNARSTGRRRVLAEWIASPAHPLTARVAANRVWQHLFGRGLVSTPNDFGHTGMAPTHPELLDWLAARFAGVPSPASKVPGPASKVPGPASKVPRRTSPDAGLGTRDPGLKPWSLKELIRTVMLSSTYMQSSRVGAAKAAGVDPGNALLWRQNLRRLEAEAIRDTVLAASGKLNLKMGGRGIFPVLPPEVLSTQSRPGAGWTNSPEEERSRRSVYIFVKRTLGVPMLESFDAPSPDSPVGARVTTTIAPQALILLNSAFMDEQSAAFAERLLREAGAEAEPCIQRAFRIALGRAPSAAEARIARAYLDRQRQACSDQLPPAEAFRKSLAAFCKVVLNLNEFVYVD